VWGFSLLNSQKISDTIIGRGGLDLLSHS
jgi:hypothetical protein